MDFRVKPGLSRKKDAKARIWFDAFNRVDDQQFLPQDLVF